MTTARASATSGQCGLELELPRPLFSATPSKLTSFDCPRRYRYTYVDRPAPPKGAPWAHNTVGSVVHNALLNWYELPEPLRTPEQGARLVRKYWQHDGFRDNAMSDAWREHAAGWIASYLHDEIDRHGAGHDPRARERQVAMRTSTLAFSGRVDRIDERDGELVIVDYKTGRTPCTDDDARGSLALALYAAAAERTFRQRCRTVELHHVPSGVVATFEHTDETFAIHLERAEQTVIDITAATDTVAGGADPDEVFEAVAGPRCSWCDFRAVCAAGQAVSSSVDPWAGLAELN